MTSTSLDFPHHPSLVLAVQPTSNGFGWVLFENTHTAVAWSLVHARAGRDGHLIKRFVRLLDRYAPVVLVLEAFENGVSRRGPRIRDLCRAMVHEASVRRIETPIFDREAVQMVFAQCGASTRDEIARVIVAHTNAFGHRLPKPRKPWMSEDPRRSLFDAAALAITYFVAMGEQDGPF